MIRRWRARRIVRNWNKIVRLVNGQDGRDLAYAHGMVEGYARALADAQAAIERLQARAEPHQQTRGGGPHSYYGALGEALVVVRRLAGADQQAPDGAGIGGD